MHLSLGAFNKAYIKRERNVYYVELSALSAQDSGNALNWFTEKGKGFLLLALTVIWLLLWHWATHFTSLFSFLFWLFSDFPYLFRTWLPIFIISFPAICKTFVHWTSGRPIAHKNTTIWVRVQKQLTQTGKIFKRSLTILCVGLACSTLRPEFNWDSYSYSSKI